MSSLKSAALIVSGLLVASCSSLNLKNAGSAVDILSQVPQTRGHAIQAKEYLGWAQKLKKFHDSGTLDEGDVLDVLKRSGVIKGGVPVPTPTGKKRPPVAQVPPPVEDYHGAYRWPVDAGVVSSEFGARWGKKHDGIDVAGDQGVPVKASANGVVVYSGSGLRGYGNVVIVRHDNKITTLYAHNKALLVKNGDHITQSQTLALLGSTGRSTGPHVHFEIREEEHALNPREKLSKANF